MTGFFNGLLAAPGLEDLFFQRSRLHRIEGIHVPVGSAEDLVIMRILAGRPKDLDDTVAILAAKPDLDSMLVRAAFGNAGQST